MARKNGNEFERLIEAVNETRDETKRSRVVNEKTLAVQSDILGRLEGIESEMKGLRTSVVASVERVFENFVATKTSALERRVELLEQTVFPPKKD